MAIKGAGIACVVAESFARIFFRNAFNMGLAIFEASGVREGIASGDHLSIDPNSGQITDHTNGRSFCARPIPSFMQDLIAAGGLMAYVLKKR